MWLPTARAGGRSAGGLEIHARQVRAAGTAHALGARLRCGPFLDRSPPFGGTPLVNLLPFARWEIKGNTINSGLGRSQAGKTW